MKIGVLSDTHKAVTLANEAVKKMGDVDMILHLGDYYSDAVSLAKMYPKIKFEFIKGNCDFGYGSESEKVIEVEGIKIFMTHGHKYNVKYDYMSLYYRAMEIGARIVLFGHTHIPTSEIIGGVYIINPGSVAMPRGGSEKSFAVLYLGGKKIDYGIMTI